MTDYNAELDLLYEYLCAWIDSPRGLKINIEAFSNKYSVEELIRIWKETGQLIRCVNEMPEPEIQPLTFEEWKNLPQIKYRNTVTRIHEPMPESMKQNIDIHYLNPEGFRGISYH